MPTEEIVVLANSRKPGGRCVAGISTATGRWVRPVSGHSPTGALSLSDCRVDGREAQLLDIVRFDYAEELNDPCQPENMLIDHSPWKLTDILPPEDAYGFLEAHLTQGPDLLGGTEKGVEEKVAQQGLAASLTVAEPNEIRFRSQDNSFRPGRQARAIFNLGPTEYNLSISDLVVAPVIKQAGDGDYLAADLDFPDLPHTVLTVSLAEPLGGTRWKLVAAVQFLR